MGGQISVLISQLLPLLGSPDLISEGAPLALQKQMLSIFIACVTSKARVGVSSLLQTSGLCSDVLWYKIFFVKSSIKSYKTYAGYLYADNKIFCFVM